MTPEHRELCSFAINPSVIKVHFRPEPVAHQLSSASHSFQYAVFAVHDLSMSHLLQ